VRKEKPTEESQGSFVGVFFVQIIKDVVLCLKYEHKKVKKKNPQMLKQKTRTSCIIHNTN